MWGEEWSHYLWIGWVNFVVSLILELLFLSQMLNNFLLGYSRYAAPCRWGRVGVVVWAADGCDLSGLGEVANADHSVRILVKGEG